MKIVGKLSRYIGVDGAAFLADLPHLLKHGHVVFIRLMPDHFQFLPVLANFFEIKLLLFVDKLSDTIEVFLDLLFLGLQFELEGGYLLSGVIFSRFDAVEGSID